MDLVEGTAPSETEKEIVYGVRAGQCGRTGHSMSNSPHFCVRESGKEENRWMIVIIELTANLPGKRSGRAGLKEGADVAVGE
jgi:hypothetical protein